MEVLLIGLGSSGDVHPMCGLAAALRARGHRVQLVASVVFEPLARRTGIDFLPLGTEEQYYEALQDPDLWHPYRSFPVVARRLIIPLMRPLYETVARRSESAEILVVAPSTAFGARIANEKLRVPLATVHLQPVLLRSIYEPPVFGSPDILGRLPLALRSSYLRLADKAIIDRLLAPEVNSFRAELGLPPVRRLFDRWVHSPQLTLGFFPEWFASPQPDWPPNVHLTGFPLYDESGSRRPSAELSDFLLAGEPPVVFTAGTGNAQASDYFRISAEVCRMSGRRAIFLTKFLELLPRRLPDCVRHFDYLPFSEVLPRSAALVHHGGIGTVSQALAAGVPQLVVPHAHDQPDNAARVRRLGAGVVLRPKQYTIENTRKALDCLLNSESIRQNCKQRARDIAAAPPLQQACVLIERLAADSTAA